ncbi:MAG: hypothetical protein K2O40_14050, partial [Lachnospiraceae bacterium]|nr:hypothetical protein [Lachnospiraceae bacterium]
PIMPSMEQNKKWGIRMDARIYKTMGRSGALSIVLGVVSIVVGLTSGVMLLISGGRLLAGKSKILF